jgi:hypothetical protein
MMVFAQTSTHGPACRLSHAESRMEDAGESGMETAKKKATEFDMARRLHHPALRPNNVKAHYE